MPFSGGFEGGFPHETTIFVSRPLMHDATGNWKGDHRAQGPAQGLRPQIVLKTAPWVSQNRGAPKMGSAENPYARSELRASPNKASRKLKRRARKPAQACGEKWLKKSPLRIRRDRTCLQFLCCPQKLRESDRYKTHARETEIAKGSAKAVC